MKKVSLKTARLLANLTQEEVAKKIGVSMNTLSSYERGKTKIPVNIAMDLVKIYKRPIDSINFF